MHEQTLEGERRVDLSIKINAYQQAISQIATSKNSTHPYLITGIDNSARAFFIANLFETSPRQIVVVESIPTKLTNLFEDLQQLLPNENVILFPSEEASAIEFAFASQDDMANRIEALNVLMRDEPCIILTNVAGIRKRLSSPAQWRNAMLKFEVGMEVNIEALDRQLFELGYQKEQMVDRPGTYSIRGGIVDIYSLNLDNPVRLDFFDTEIDSIRFFDAQTQVSTHNIDEIIISPAKDIIFSLADQQAMVPQLHALLQQKLNKISDTQLAEQIQYGMGNQLTSLIEGEPLKYPSAYLGESPLGSATLLDYLNETGTLMTMDFDKVQQRAIQLVDEDHFWIEQEVAKGLLLPGMEIHAPVRETIRNFEGVSIYCSVIQKGLGNLALEAIFNFQYRSITPFFNQMPFVKTEMDHWIKQENAIVVLVSSTKDAKKTATLFEEFNISPVVITEHHNLVHNAINIVVMPISSGFELPVGKIVVVTEHELFNQIKKRLQKSSSHLSNAERIKSYSELTIGDYVVHENHGIGKFMGMDTIEMNGIHRDLLSVVYQDNSRILIPADQINSLQKYVSSDSKTPKLNKLGGTEWAKTKKKVASKIEDIADELIALYAKREKEVGYAFSQDTPEQSEFENAFSYVETDDQLRSAIEIKQDMEKPKPMDRLLVGDVGYGKTEVAMRAIFKAVMDGKQVAFLVPTTILAQQHYNSLVQRFAEYPFEIGMLSRFVTKSRQEEVIEGLKLGRVNIVVGTHRVLSKDIAFQDLGLLIVDEEQRFGVKHKERLKQLKSQVDVLTLTATPIPRTLHMSMIGVRDLSLIETPPSNRFPVQTYVMEKNEGAIKTGIEREMARGGQVFYLYNRVATIEQRALEIEALVPEARVAIAHGQMTEVQLERVLVDFIQGEYDVLVTTTIIETGVDIPNANTLFVEDADHMGLSTLYQLRGRVGRTNRVAYAYLMYDGMKSLTEVSEKRLSAIREFTELGSGFKIAMRDLSIRGAGNLLGKQQSGFIDSVGFDMYSQMLKEAVDIKRGKTSPSSTATDNQIDWDIKVNAYIPSHYVQDERQKIAVYKQIQHIDSKVALMTIQDQLIDRFGEYPDEVADLLEISLIRHYGMKVGLIKVVQSGPFIKTTFMPKTSEKLAGVKIFEALEPVKLKAQVNEEDNKLTVQLNIQGKATYEWLTQLKTLIESVAHVVNINIDNE